MDLKKGSKRLRDARKNLGITQVALAKRLHVSKSTLCRWENVNDTYFPRDEILMEYSKLFHKLIFFWKGENMSEEVALFTKELQKLLDNIQKAEQEILELKTGYEVLERKMQELLKSLKG